MTKEEAKHIVDVVFDVPQAVRRIGEDRTYHEDEIREAKNMAIRALEDQEPKPKIFKTTSFTVKPETMEKYRREIVKQMEEGIVLLPNCIELVEDKSDLLDKIRAEIEPKCDRINSLASVLPYTAHREIQELLREIMDLCKESEGI